MQTNENTIECENENHPVVSAGRTDCPKLLADLATVKAGVAAEFSQRLAGREALLRLALSEAEALAWDTNYPQLVFATLAQEKAQAAATWETRQQLLSHHLPVYARVQPKTREKI